MELAEATAGPVIMAPSRSRKAETLELPPSGDHEHFVLVLSGELKLAPGNAPGALVRAWYAGTARAEKCRWC